MRSLNRLLFERFGWLVGAACALQLVVVLVVYPGCLVIDEVTYHAMTRALVRTGSLALDNGWNVVASPELEWEHARAIASASGEPGRLVAQYPYGFPFLVAPLYAVAGQRAFLILNTLAFYGTILVTRALAFDVFRKRSLAVTAALIFALGSYAWEYSFAIWPHSVTLLLCTAAVVLSVRAHEGERSGRRQLAAGALVGAATTIRLDALFAMAAVLLVPLILPRKKTRMLATLEPLVLGVVGLAPGLALLAWTNHLKFGTWQPLSYGPWHAAGSNTGLFTYLPLATLGIATIAAAHLISPRAARIQRRHVLWLACVVAVLVALLLAIPSPLRSAARRVVDGLWMIVLDLRHSNPNAVQRGLTHGPRGAMMYVGALKKAFVQSIPWLPLAAVAPFFSGVTEDRRRRLVALGVPVVVNVGVFGALAWHGGLCLNLRYLLPALPFAAILAAYGGYRLARRAPGLVRQLRQLDAIVLIAVAAWFVLAVVAVYPSSVSVHAIFLLDAPLVLAALLTAALVVARRQSGKPPHRDAATVALVLALVAVVWAGMTELTYDAVATIGARRSNHAAAAMVLAHAPRGSFVFAAFPDLVSDTIENENVVAEPSRDDYKSVVAVVAAAARHGHPSYAVLNDAAYDQLRASTKGDLLVGEPLARHAVFTLRRLEPASR